MRIDTADEAPSDRLQLQGFCKHRAFRCDVIVFRLNATAVGQSGLQPAFLPNPAERGYSSGEAHNPEVAGFKSCPRY